MVALGTIYSNFVKMALQTTDKENLLGMYQIKTITFIVNDKEYKGFDANMSLLERTLTWSYLYNIDNK